MDAPGPIVVCTVTEVPRVYRSSAECQKTELNQLFFGILDQTVGELKERFSAKNISLLKSLKTLVSFERIETDVPLFIYELSSLGSLVKLTYFEVRKKFLQDYHLLGGKTMKTWIAWTTCTSKYC